MVLLDEGKDQLAAAIVCLSLSIIAVGTRFWCKLVMKNGLHWDDWWILAACITYAGGQSAHIWGESWGVFSRDTILFSLLAYQSSCEGIIAGAGGLELPQLAAQLAMAPSPEKAGELANYLEVRYHTSTGLFLLSRVMD
jgi:hypothetical protein